MSVSWRSESLIALLAALCVTSVGCRPRRQAPRAAPLVASSARRPVPPEAAVFEPSGMAPGERRPLLVALHGLGGSGARLFEQLGLAALGRSQRLFVVAPDGTLDRQGRRFWNAGGACCDFDHAAVDDVGRLTSLIDDWRARPAVDPRRVYVVGYSNGGFMAHRLACVIGDRLAAIASLAGAGPDPGQPCAATSPIGVLEAHGDRDPIVAYQGGRVFGDPRLLAHPAARETLDGWASRLGCRATRTDSAVGAAGARVTRAAGCRSGSAELWTIAGGGHDIIAPALLDDVWGFLLQRSKPPR
jgi:polyhydroxybutyrate depolymerase